MDGDEIMPQDDSFQNENERKSVDISLKEVLDTIDEEVNSREPTWPSRAPRLLC